MTVCRLHICSAVVVFISLHFCFVSGQYEDVRCKCVCPSVPQTNTSTQSRKVFVKSFHEPAKCKCENVVDPLVQQSQYRICERCDCQWQRRNTTTIKVVVIFIICVVGLLFLYMLFLLCLDPLMTRRPVAYTEQHNEQPEEVSMEVQGSDWASATSADRASVMSRVRHQVRGEQQRWKGAVQEQRRHIYDHHTMLN